eukprot:3179955-Prymnesium_polylepis.1
MPRVGPPATTEWRVSCAIAQAERDRVGRVAPQHGSRTTTGRSARDALRTKKRQTASAKANGNFDVPCSGS